MKHFNYPLIALVVGLLSVANPPNSSLVAQTPEASPNTRMDLGNFSQQLTSPKFTTRREAMLRGWADIGESRAEVSRLLEIGDPESRSRAQWILEQWEIGLVPGLPSDIHQRLSAAQGQPSRALGVLLDYGYLPQAVELAQKHLRSDNPKAEELRPLFATVITNGFPNIIRAAVENDQIPLALELLDICSETHWMIVARAILLQRLGTPLSDENILPKNARSWDPDQQAEMAITAFAVCGDFDQAARRARQADRDDFLASVLLLDGRWEALAELQKTLAEKADSTGQLGSGFRPQESMSLDHALWVLATAQTNSAQEALPKAIESLKNSLTPLDIQWRVLAAAGSLEDAIAIAKEADLASAADILTLGQRHAEAFELLGVNPYDAGPALRGKLKEIAQGIADETAQRQNRLPITSDRRRTETLVNEYTTTVRLLSSIGQFNLVEPAILELAELQGSNYTGREALMTALRLGRESLVAKIISRTDEESRGNLEMIAGFFLTDRNPAFFAKLHQAVKATQREASAEDHWRMTVDLSMGVLPDGWDEGDQLERFYAAILDGPALGTLGPESPSHLAGQLFLSLDRPDLATDAYKVAAQGGDLMSRLQIALAELNGGDAESSLQQLEDIFAELCRSSTLDSAKTGFVPRMTEPPSACAILAAIGLAHERLGHDEKAEKIRRALNLLPLDPIDNSRDPYVEALENFDMIEQANDAAIHQVRFALMTGDTSFYSTAYALAQRLAIDDADQAAQWARIALMGTIGQRNLYPTGYLSVPARWCAFSSLAAMKRGDLDAAASALRNSLVFYPLNIDMGEEVLPKLREHGFEALADEILDQMLAVGKSYVEQFPLDANSHNNLAWIAAINGRHLQDAHARAQRAVFLQPDSTSYRDTLAEVLFRLGQSQEAVQLEKQCIADSPDQWHLHEQLHRFESTPQP